MSLANGNVTHILLDWASGQRQSERQRYIAGMEQEEQKSESEQEMSCVWEDTSDNVRE